MMEKYRVDISAANCNYEIKVNDFPILTERKGYQENTFIDVNHLIQGSNFSLAINIYPIDKETFLGEGAQLELTVSSYTNDPKNKTELYKYSYQYAPKQSNATSVKLINLENFNNLPVWIRSEKVELKNISAGLVNRYWFIWSLFNNKDIDGILKQFERRELTYANSYEESISSRIGRTSEIYDSYFKDANFELFPFSPQYFSTKIYGLGKLMCLEEEDGFPPIFYLNKERNRARYIPFYFSSFEGNLEVSL